MAQWLVVFACISLIHACNGKPQDGSESLDSLLLREKSLLQAQRSRSSTLHQATGRVFNRAAVVQSIAMHHEALRKAHKGNAFCRRYWPAGWQQHLRSVKHSNGLMGAIQKPLKRHLRHLRAAITQANYTIHHTRELVFRFCGQRYSMYM